MIHRLVSVFEPSLLPPYYQPFKSTPCQLHARCFSQRIIDHLLQTAIVIATSCIINSVCSAGSFCQWLSLECQNIAGLVILEGAVWKHLSALNGRNKMYTCPTIRLDLYIRQKIHRKNTVKINTRNKMHRYCIANLNQCVLDRKKKKLS